MEVLPTELPQNETPTKMNRTPDEESSSVNATGSSEQTEPSFENPGSPEPEKVEDDSHEKTVDESIPNKTEEDSTEKTEQSPEKSQEPEESHPAPNSDPKQVESDSAEKNEQSPEKAEEVHPEPTEHSTPEKVEDPPPEPTEHSTPEKVEEENQPKIYGLLSEDELLEAMYLVSVYREFWENKKFKLGWEQPVIPLKSVEHLLEEAAEIVTQLKAKNSVSPVGGNAHEYLWNLESLPPADEFVRDLIHATLQHADGYVDGLNQNTVDEGISKIVQAQLQNEGQPMVLQATSREGKELEKKIKDSWANTTNLLNEVLSDSNTLWTSSLVSELDNVQSSIEALRRQIDCFQARKSFKQQSDLSSRCKQQQEIAPEPTKSTPEEIEETKTGLLKVEIVHQKVTNLTSELSSLTNTVEGDIKNLGSLAQNPKKSMEHITEMKKKAAIYLDQLSKDLDVLDAISAQNLRALRKKEVLHVQQLIESVEKVQDQIFKLEEEIKPAAEAQERQEKEEDEKKQAEEKKLAEERAKAIEKQTEDLQRKKQEIQKQHAKIEQARQNAKVPSSSSSSRQVALKEPEAPIDLEAAWKNLKLDVSLKTQELRDAYVIVGNIPNMKREDITIRIEEDKLIVGGFRGPTKAELETMLRHLQTRTNLHAMTQRERALAVLRCGVGKFGTWSQVFSLPSEVDRDEIEASYNHGVLKLTLPKKQQRSPPRGYFDPYSEGSPIPRSLHRSPYYEPYQTRPRYGYRNPNQFSGFW